MDDGSTFLLLAALILLFLAVYFAVAETAFASVSKIQVIARNDSEERQAANALLILDDIDKTISTILVGTNIAHLCIASLITVYTTRTWGIIYVPVSTAVVTVVVFFIGELVPKCVAKRFSRSLALATAGSLIVFCRILSPVTAVLTGIGEWFSGHLRQEPEAIVTEDELYDIIEDMTEDGELASEQGDLISSALAFADITAGDVLVPIEEVSGINLGWDERKILDYISSERHSRLPVYVNDLRNVIGVIQIRKYIKAVRSGEEIVPGSAPDLSELMDRPFYARHDMPVSELFTKMSRKKAMMSFIVDDEQEVIGIVTVEDIVEEIIGDIWDETDRDIAGCTPLGKNRWMVERQCLAGEWFTQVPGLEERLNNLHCGTVSRQEPMIDWLRRIFGDEWGEEASRSVGGYTFEIEEIESDSAAGLDAAGNDAKAKPERVRFSCSEEDGEEHDG